jgi:hypothetical protein
VRALVITASAPIWGAAVRATLDFACRLPLPSIGGVFAGARFVFGGVRCGFASAWRAGRSVMGNFSR